MFMRLFMVRFLAVVVFVAAVASLAPSSNAQQPPINAGIVYSRGGTQASPIYIAPFKSKSAESYPADFFNKIVTNDLKLSGIFQPPQNEAFAAETNRLDEAQGTIHFAEWIKLGVPYVVTGQYEISGNKLKAQIKAWDTNSQSLIFGWEFSDYDKQDSRLLAHKVSNLVQERLTGEKGVADTRIAFIKQLDSQGKTKQVCVMDADGANVRAYTQKNELTAAPCWGAMGTEVYYTTWRDYNPDLAGVILSTGQSWFISRKAGMNLSPAWCESRKLIALTMTKDGNSELYTMTREGRNLTRLTTSSSIDSSPSWSPDGRQLAFTSDRSGSPQIYVMDVDTRDVRRITYQGSYNDGAAWSPKGDRIAFSSQINGEFQICSAKPDGSELTQLTSGGDNSLDPTWAPNGLMIGFASDRSGRYQVYSMFHAGGNEQQLTTGDASQMPAWSPFAP